VPERIVFNDLARLNAELRGAIDQAIDRVLDSGMFLRGRECAAFEEEWAEVCGQRFAVVCNSGTDALTLAAAAHELESASVQANTLSLTAIGLHRGGAKVDVREIDEHGHLDGAFDDAVPVLLFGRLPSEAERATSLVDAAHAHGWIPEPHMTATWSFYPTKTLGGLGDGGAVTTNDAAAAQAMREIRGVDDQFHHGRQITSRMDELQAAVLRVKLRHLPGWIEARGQVAARYDERLGVFGICDPHASLHHLYVIRTHRRDELARALAEQGIETKVHWAQSLADAPGPWGAPDESYARSRAWSQEVLSLPCHPFLGDGEIERVCDAIEMFLDSAGS
jgi:dTDP-4-amino-4,6-dideoxygalactose transaminase